MNSEEEIREKYIRKLKESLNKTSKQTISSDCKQSLRSLSKKGKTNNGI